MFLFFSLVLVASDQPRHIEIAIIARSDKPSINTPSYVGIARQGAKLAIEDYKARLFRRGLVVKARDYFVTDDSLSAHQEAQKAMTDGTLFAVGLQSSNDAAVAAKAVEGSDYVLLSTFATSTDLRKFWPNLILMSPTNDIEANAVEMWTLNQKRFKRIAALINWENQYSKNMYDNFSQSFKNRVELFKVISEMQNPDQWVERVVAFKPDVIVLPSFPVPAATAIQMLVAAGYRGEFVAGATWGDSTDQRFAEILKDIPYKGSIIRPYSILNPTKKEVVLKNRLKKEFGFDDYTPIAALYYDTTSLALESLLKIGRNVTRESFLKRMKKQEKYSGVLGTFCLNDRHCAARTFRVLKVENNIRSYLTSFSVK